MFAGRERMVDADLAAGTCSFVFDSMNVPNYMLLGRDDSTVCHFNSFYFIVLLSSLYSFTYLNF